jgi:hypothetical protein
VQQPVPCAAVPRRALIAVAVLVAVLLAGVAVVAVAGSGPSETERFRTCLERHGATPGGKAPDGAKVTARATVDGHAVTLHDLGRDRRPVVLEGSPDVTFDWRAGYDRARRAFWACVALVEPRPLP